MTSAGSHVAYGAFCIEFHATKGNTIAHWVSDYIPRPTSSELEFKGMATGFHHSEEDFVLFMYKGYYGIAAFAKAEDPTAPRGVKMFSAGLLSERVSSLLAEKPALFNEVHRICAMETPDFGGLTAVFNGIRSTEPMDSAQPALIESGPSSIPLVVSHSGGYTSAISYFVSLLGTDVLMLWKAILLRQRVLLFLNHPVGSVCGLLSVVLQMCHRHNEGRFRMPSPRALYYVCVTDIDELMKPGPFVACTTEKILMDKADLFDVLVNCDGRTASVKIGGIMKKALAHTSGDKARLGEIQPIATKAGASMHASQHVEAFIRFFSDMNERLFGGLEQNGGKKVTMANLISSCALTLSDRRFLRALLSEMHTGISIKRSARDCCCG